MPARKRLRRYTAGVLILTALACLVCAAALVWPEASGDKTLKKGGTTIDASHVQDGYIMVKQKKSSKRLKFRVSRGDDQVTYDLNGEGDYEVFPLQFGDGTYKLVVYKQVSGNQYSQASSQSLKVELTDPNAPYLCPNQYVWYTEESETVQKSRELCENLSSDSEKVETVYAYVAGHITYDYMRALTVQSGYLPDVDQVLSDGMGICFDYAALMCCMLRVQGIPAQLVIGYADEAYHAWNSVYVDGEWKRYDATAKAANMSVGQYTTERWY